MQGWTLIQGEITRIKAVFLDDNMNPTDKGRTNPRVINREHNFQARPVGVCPVPPPHSVAPLPPARAHNFKAWLPVVLCTYL